MVNFGTLLGGLAGTALIAAGLAMANGVALDENTLVGLGIAGVLMLGVTLGAFVKHRSFQPSLAAIGAPFAVLALVSLAPLPISSAPVMALAHVSTAVERGNDGHFRADARINGVGTIEMLVDTGASVVLLSHEHAIELGIAPSELTFDVPVITANGRSSVALIELASLNVGGVTLEGVDAAVAQPGQLHSSLLGMSYLGALKEVVLRGNEMILKN